MFAKTLLVAFALALVVAVTARTSDSAGAEQPYVVKRYDTLWSIATAHYAGIRARRCGRSRSETA